MLHQYLQSLYGGSPNVSFFKGGGTAQMGPILDMPDNSSSGDVSPSLLEKALSCNSPYLFGVIEFFSRCYGRYAPGHFTLTIDAFPW